MRDSVFDLFQIQILYNLAASSYLQAKINITFNIKWIYLIKKKTYFSTFFLINLTRIIYSIHNIVNKFKHGNDLKFYNCDSLRSHFQGEAVLSILTPVLAVLFKFYSSHWLIYFYKEENFIKVAIGIILILYMCIYKKFVVSL